MAWVNGGPGSHIPSWIKLTVRQRQGNRCNTINPAKCLGRIDQFDHTTNVKTLGISRAQSYDTADNFQGLCEPCHKTKTQAESLAARQRRQSRRRLPTTPHPGDA
jgi:hypothetical protein